MRAAQIIILVLMLAAAHKNFILNSYHSFSLQIILYICIIISAFFFCTEKNKQTFGLNDILLIIAAFLFNLINTFFIHSNILAGGTFIMTAFGIINLYSEEKYKERLFWLACLMVLLLPVREYFQCFIGVPIRLLSADVTEKLLHAMNFNTISQNGILIFENNITNIDYPCSGSASIYYVLIFTAIIGILKPLTPGLKTLSKILLSVFLVIFLNIVRIFILVLLSLSPAAADFGNIIHSGLGIINFILALSVLLTEQRKNSVFILKSKIITRNGFNYFLTLIFLICLPVFIQKPDAANQNKFKIIKHREYKNLEVSAQEKSLYGKYGAEIEKYDDGEKIVIKIKSSSIKALHNPELCLKNQGFIIYERKTVTDGNIVYKELKTNKGNVRYYYTDGEVYLDDYYKKTFFSLKNGSKPWIEVIEIRYK